MIICKYISEQKCEASLHLNISKTDQELTIQVFWSTIIWNHYLSLLLPILAHILISLLFNTAFNLLLNQVDNLRFFV